MLSLDSKLNGLTKRSNTMAIQAKAIFEEVFGHIKNLPIPGSTASQALTSQQQEARLPRPEAPPPKEQSMSE